MNSLENQVPSSSIDDFTQKIRDLITELRQTKPDDIKFLVPSHADLINTIFSQYTNFVNRQKNSKPKAEIIFLAAPTGAGKDSLVRRIKLANPNTQYALLNMDMFRHYHNEIIGSPTRIPDEHYASTTNQTSYEIYFIIQELILREFPGTNVIITGTMRNLEWVREIINRYKSDPNTDYTATLVALPVPSKDSAFSIFARYLRKVEALLKEQSAPDNPHSQRSLRYTSLKYHDNTTSVFASNIKAVEEELHSAPTTSTFDRIKVHRRAFDITNPNENTLLYDSTNPHPSESAFFHVSRIISSKPTITLEKIQELFIFLDSEMAKTYLTEQGLYDTIKQGLTEIKSYINQITLEENSNSR